MGFQLDISENFDFYLNETTAGITEIREEGYKIRHATVSDDQHIL